MLWSWGMTILLIKKKKVFAWNICSVLSSFWSKESWILLHSARKAECSHCLLCASNLDFCCWEVSVALDFCCSLFFCHLCVLPFFFFCLFSSCIFLLLTASPSSFVVFSLLFCLPTPPVFLFLPFFFRIISYSSALRISHDILSDLKKKLILFYFNCPCGASG